MSTTRFIVGLGNPGREYQYTRHNLGYLVVQKIAELQKISFKRSSLTEGAVAEFEHGGNKVILLMPLTYMNHSGRALGPILQAESIDLNHTLVIADDLDLSFGQVRIRAKGSDGGHNGLASVIESLKTQNFSRLRMGIGKPVDKGQTIEFVLEEFTKEEKKQLDLFIQEAVDCCMAWLKEGIHKAMERFNQRKDNE